MFGRKKKAALAALPPQHQALVTGRYLAVVQPPAAWDQLWATVGRHHELAPRSPLPPRLREVVLPLLRALAEDVDDDGTIGATLDLRGPDDPSKLHPGRPLTPRPPVTRAEETISWDPWLAVQASLRSGAELQVTVVDVTWILALRKRSASGKTKHKTKRKAHQRLTVVLKTAKGAEVVPPPPSPATGWLRVSSRPKGERAQISAKAKFPLSTPVDPTWQLRTIMLAIAEVVRWVPAPEEGDGDADAPVPAPAGAAPSGAPA